MSVNNNSHEVAATREQLKKERKTNGEALSQKRKRIRVRLIPVWLRVIIVAVLIILATITGAVFGYSVIGDGKVSEVFKKSTWTHIVDLVNKK